MELCWWSVSTCCRRSLWWAVTSVRCSVVWQSVLLKVQHKTNYWIEVDKHSLTCSSREKCLWLVIIDCNGVFLHFFLILGHYRYILVVINMVSTFTRWIVYWLLGNRLFLSINENRAIGPILSWLKKLFC